MRSKKAPSASGVRYDMMGVKRINTIAVTMKATKTAIFKTDLDLTVKALLPPNLPIDDVLK